MNDAFTLYQWGKEGTPGTAVAATSKIAIERMNFDYDDLTYRPSLARGIAARYRGNETTVRNGSRWSVPESPVVYDQLQNWLAMSVAGGLTPVDNDPEFTWTAERSLVADPDPDSFTIERRLTDGSSPSDVEWAYCLASKIGFRGAIDSPLRFMAEGFGRRRQASTLTAALAMPTVEIPPFALSRLYIDDTWGAIGGTQISAQIIGWSVDFTTGFYPQPTADGRTDLDFTIHKLNADNVALDVSITALVGAQYLAEATKARAQALRAVRISTVDGSGGRNVVIDMMLKHEFPDVYVVGEQDGQVIVNFSLKESADDGSNIFRVSVTNAVETMV